MKKSEYSFRLEFEDGGTVGIEINPENDLVCKSVYNFSTEISNWKGRQITL